MSLPQNTAGDGYAVSKSDTEDLPEIAQAFWINVAGTIQITTLSGNVLALVAPAGSFPWKARKVWSTNTAASGIFAITSK